MFVCRAASMLPSECEDGCLARETKNKNGNNSIVTSQAPSDNPSIAPSRAPTVLSVSSGSSKDNDAIGEIKIGSLKIELTKELIIGVCIGVIFLFVVCVVSIYCCTRQCRMNRAVKSQLKKEKRKLNNNNEKYEKMMADESNDNQDEGENIINQGESTIHDDIAAIEPLN